MNSWVMNWLNGTVHRVVVNGAASVWQLVTNDPSLGSVLGPFLFNIFTSDLYAGVECILRKFSDDTKVGGAIDTLWRNERMHPQQVGGDTKVGVAFDSMEGQALQRDQIHWSIEKSISNGMKFHKGKCWALHLGQSNTRHGYTLWR